MSELRWILLLAGMVFLVGLAAWETRRVRRAKSAANASMGPGFADVARTVPPPPSRSWEEHREPQLGELPDGIPDAPSAESSAPLTVVDEVDLTAAGLDDATLEPLEPIEPLAAELDDAALDAAQPIVPAAEQASAPKDANTTGAGAEPDESASDRTGTSELVVDWPPEGERQIVALRLVGTTEQRLSGRATRQALAACGFVHGRYRIFHQPSRDGRALLSCASLSKPGNFDLGSMDFQRFSGLSLFTVLPGPLPESVAIDRLLETARDLERRLHARLEDDQGQMLDAARIAAMRRSAVERAHSGSEPTA